MNRQDNDKLRIIVCRPGERAEMIEINNNLDAIQAILGGPPEEYLPFDDPSDPRMEEVAL